MIEAESAGWQGSEHEKLIAHGVDVKLDSNPDLMHHKVMITDGGSWSRGAITRHGPPRRITTRTSSWSRIPKPPRSMRGSFKGSGAIG
ncbi:MAG: hypothetical protein L2C94_002120 [Aigarchaeota archaeon]|nr:hypothetical protein [Candidatus Wolframiiraptor gerlachensis]